MMKNGRPAGGARYLGRQITPLQRQRKAKQEACNELERDTSGITNNDIMATDDGWKDDNEIPLDIHILSRGILSSTMDGNFCGDGQASGCPNSVPTFPSSAGLKELACCRPAILFWLFVQPMHSLHRVGFSHRLSR